MRIAGLTTLVAMTAPLLACSPQVTFSEHIAPILQAKCQSCHRPGQMAPMPLLTYEQARPFAPVIRTSVAIGNMPPFYAVGPSGYYKDDIRLTEEEKRLITQWADSGAPEGDPELLPTPIEWDDSEWPFGEPDLVLHLPVHVAPPVNHDQVVTLFADQAFSDDIWARAIHLKPRTKKAVHHATVFLVDGATEIPVGGKTFDHIRPELVQASRTSIFTWLPGLTIDPLPDGQAIFLPASNRIVARTHFGPTRKRRAEKIDVGIYFADGVIDRIRTHLGFQFRQQIRIPPGASDFTLSGKKRFKEAAEITHFMVHMHLRGKSTRIILHYPDGSKQTVFDLPRYRFYWQRYYYLAEPLSVPLGTTAEWIATWDNSKANPLNPDATAWCSWGRKTTDEMYFSSIFYTPKNKRAKPLLIENGRLVESSILSPLGPAEQPL